MIEQAAKPMVKVNIDGREISVEKGSTIFEAARKLKIDIPHYCYDRDLTIVASCRLCLVEIENIPKLQPSCSTPVNEGQVIHTQSQKVLDARKMQMEFLLVQHPLDCPVCDQGGECKLQEYSRNHGFDETRFRYQRRTFPKPDIGPFVDIERNRCILCTRCTRFMEEVAGNAELSIAKRGNRAYISTFQDRPLKNEFAGNTIDLCPVGALTSKITRFRVRPWELKSVPSVCSLCAVGCNIKLQYRTRTHEVLRILPRENDDVNKRWICDIGRFGFDQFNSGERLRTPRLKNESGELEDAKWGMAITRVAETLKKTAEAHGPGSVAGVIAPRASNETLYLFQKFMREAVGTNNIDHRAQSAVYDNDDGYIASLALNAANNPFEEIHRSSVILSIGSDLPNEAPILSLQVRRCAVRPSDVVDHTCRPFSPTAVYQPPEARKRISHVILAHGRPTRIDKDVQQPVRYRPGAEGWFIAALAAAVAKHKGIPLPSELEGVDPGAAAGNCGADPEAVEEAAMALAGADRATILAGQSVYDGPGGVDRVTLVSALAEMLRKPDETKRPFSLVLPHNNSRGAADMGCYPHRGPGYAPVDNPGKNLTEILHGCVDGSIKALIVFGADLVEDYPDRALAAKALETVPFLAVADVWPGDSIEHAEAVLPLSARTEEDGTYTNMAGRVQRAHKSLQQLDGTLSGVQVLLALGERWGKGWKQIDPRKIPDQIAAEVSHYAGLSWQRIGPEGVQANEPVPEWFVGAARPFGGMFEADGKPEDGALRLVRGRYLFDRSGEKRFAEALVKRSEECAVEIHPDDANRLNLTNGEKVKIMGENGALELPLRVSTATFRGCASILGSYEDLPVNGIVNENSPWVTVRQ